MNDMELYSAIEAVVNFDLENDPDLIAVESEIETIDYAMESAQLEYELTGDERFESVIEASLKKKILSEDNWFGKLVATIKKFIRNALQSIRAMLNRIANKIRLMKAKSMQKQVKAAGKSKLDHSVDISKSAYAMLTFSDEDTKNLKKDMTAMVNEYISRSIAAARKYGSFDKNQIKKVLKTGATVTEKKKLGKDDKVKIDIKTVKSYLDIAVKMLTQLDKSFPSVKKTIDKYKATPQDRQYVRLGVNFAYNVVTEGVRKYYSTAMSVARIATGGQSGGEYAGQVKPGKPGKSILNPDYQKPAADDEE